MWNGTQDAHLVRDISLLITHTCIVVLVMSGTFWSAFWPNMYWSVIFPNTHIKFWKHWYFRCSREQINNGIVVNSGYDKVTTSCFVSFPRNVNVSLAHLHGHQESFHPFISGVLITGFPPHTWGSLRAPLGQVYLPENQSLRRQLNTVLILPTRIYFHFTGPAFGI